MRLPWWSELAESVFFHDQICFDIAMSRLDVFVPKPECYHGRVDARLEQVHRRGVSIMLCTTEWPIPRERRRTAQNHERELRRTGSFRSALLAPSWRGQVADMARSRPLQRHCHSQAVGKSLRTRASGCSRPPDGCQPPFTLPDPRVAARIGGKARTG